MAISLSPVWFCEHVIDYEYQQYILLNYLKDVQSDFKASVLNRYFYDVQYHIKNMECFLTTRQYIESIDRKLTQEQMDAFKMSTSHPDDDPRTIELLRIAKWASKKLQNAMDQGTATWQIIEKDLNLFYVGENNDKLKNAGYVIIQYTNSPIVEKFKFEYKPRLNDIVFRYAGYVESNMKQYQDVMDNLTNENKGKSMVFFGLTSPRSYNTKESVIPVLKQIMLSRIFSARA